MFLSHFDSLSNRPYLDLETEAYSAIISAFRAQGELTWRKDRVLQELRILLRIPEEKQRLELIRVANDEALNEIAK
jgi:hypothetical protein